MEEIRVQLAEPWDKLGNVNEQVLANYLKNEYPQTVAVVLSKIKSDHAREFVSFAGELCNGSYHATFAMETVQKEV